MFRIPVLLNACRRSMSSVTITFNESTFEKMVNAPLGDNLMNVAKRHGFDVPGTCGGNMACCTCHMVLPEKIFKMDQIQEDEDDMLDYVDRSPTSCLGCQVGLC